MLLVIIASSFAVLTKPDIVWGHGVPESSIVHIENEQFSDNTLVTGEQLTITGEIRNLSGNDLRVSSLSLMAESSFDLGEPWEILARDPQTESFDLPSGTTIPYMLTVKVLRPNTYHIHTQVDIQGGQTVFGRGQTVNVQGEPLNGLDQGTGIALLVIIPLAVGGGVGGVVLWKVKIKKGTRQQEQHKYPNVGPTEEPSPAPPQTENSVDRGKPSQEPSLKESKFKE